MALSVNFSTLKRLAGEVGHENVADLLVVFSEELVQYRHQLRETASMNEVQEISHAIKSTAESFGADELAEMAQEYEVRSQLGQDSWLKEHLPQLAKMLEDMSDEYKELSNSKNLLDS